MALDRLGNTITTGTVYVVAGTARVIDGDQIVLVGGNGGETVVRARAGDIARVDDLSGGGAGGGGVAEIDFGAFPGKSDASVTITGQTSIGSGAAVQAWLQPAATADHTADEHRVETITVCAGNITPATGFTIYAQNGSQINEPLGVAGAARFRQTSASIYGYAGRGRGGRGTRIWGKWSVGWRWL